MLVFQEIIAQAFDGYPPFLTHQAQSCGFDLRIRQVKAFFHLFSICEEREHRASLSKMQARKELGKRRKIRGVLGLWHV